MVVFPVPLCGPIYGAKQHCKDVNEMGGLNITNKNAARNTLHVLDGTPWKYPMVEEPFTHLMEP